MLASSEKTIWTKEATIKLLVNWLREIMARLLTE